MKTKLKYPIVMLFFQILIILFAFIPNTVIDEHTKYTVIILTNFGLLGVTLLHLKD